jgi:hypothetical protein
VIDKRRPADNAHAYAVATASNRMSPTFVQNPWKPLNQPNPKIHGTSFKTIGNQPSPDPAPIQYATHTGWFQINHKPENPDHVQALHQDPAARYIHFPGAPQFYLNTNTFHQFEHLLIYD